MASSALLTVDADHLGEQISASLRVPPFGFGIDDIDESPGSLGWLRQAANGPLDIRVMRDKALQSRLTVALERTLRLADHEKPIAALGDKVDGVQSEEVDRISQSDSDQLGGVQVASLSRSKKARHVLDQHERRATVHFPSASRNPQKAEE